MRTSDLDRDALIHRNIHMTKAFHTTGFRHRMRGLLLEMLRFIPVPTVRADAHRILLIRPDHLGDVLLTTPAIKALRAAFPQAEIHALAGAWSAGVLASYPEIDMVLTLPFPAFTRQAEDSAWYVPYAMALRSARHLRRVGYQSAVILRPDHWWGALLARLAGIPQRVGYDLPGVRNFVNEALEFRQEHAVMQNLRLVEVLTGSPSAVEYEFPVNAADREYIDEYLHDRGVGYQQNVFCIHPGTGAWVKHWDVEKWATVADTLTEQRDAEVVLTGSSHERALVGSIATHMKNRPHLLAGDTTVGQLAALYARARVVLGPDSGPLHLAAAVNGPTVALFGPADPVEFAPWGTQEQHVVLASNIACRPCRVLDWADDNPAFHPCVREITVGQVLEAARLVAR